MTHHITHISQRAYDCFMQASQTTSTAAVHSIYGRTINLMVAGELVALQTSGSPFSPITLLTDLNKDAFYHASKSVKGIKSVQIQNDSILFMNAQGETLQIFDYSNAHILDMKLCNCTTNIPVMNLKNILLDIISHSTTGGFDLLFNEPTTEPNSLVLSYAKRVIHHSAYLCKNHVWNEAVEGLSSLVGVGTGLTPSGDDFLCGILAGLKLIDGSESHKELVHFRELLVSGIQNKLDKTLDISRAFLTCAIEDEYSEAVLELITAVTKKERDDCTRQISDAFHAIGHSSGIDTLCGIYFVLENLVTID